ncbi:MAG: PhoPQ-activated pathogenicity-related family protein, partial [Armatimonadetes bacterium]|nr:PhoPQ-activated pathogenicity-related family protein [Armatimonadota bacterium]
ETEAGRRLSAMVDPYTFRQMIRIPKLIINGTNDRYWTLDAANLYYPDLTGPKNLLYVPNAGHGLQDLQRVVGGIGAFWNATSKGLVLPPLRGEFSRLTNDGPERLQLLIRPGGIAPRAVRVWWAASDTRDFRESTWEAVPARVGENTGRGAVSSGVQWMIVPKSLTQPGAYYIAALTPPPGRYAAMFGEVEYVGENGTYHLSTQVGIVGPDAPAKATGTSPTRRTE